MKALERTFVWVMAWTVAALACAETVSAQATAAPRRNWRQEHAAIQARNAARIDKGGRISLELIGEEIGRASCRERV
mgnify:CR=1 FL=1